MSEEAGACEGWCCDECANRKEVTTGDEARTIVNNYAVTINKVTYYVEETIECQSEADSGSYNYKVTDEEGKDITETPIGEFLISDAENY